MAYLIYTDFVIFSLEGNESVRRWMLARQNVPRFILVVAYGELICGARTSRHPERNAAAAARTAELFPIVEISKGIAEVFGGLKAKLALAGNRMDDMELLMAATSMCMNMPQATNDKKHFSKIHDLVLEPMGAA